MTSKRVTSSLVCIRPGALFAIPLIAILSTGCSGGNASLSGLSPSSSNIAQTPENSAKSLAFQTHSTVNALPAETGAGPSAVFVPEEVSVQTTGISYQPQNASRTVVDGMSLTEFPVPAFRDPASGRTLYPSPHCITVGPDGALWFTDLISASIWRVTTSGAFTVFPLTENSDSALADDPENITAGEDGALWFTESGTDRIGRITTGGSLTEFSLARNGGGMGTGPAGIAAGPLGAIWFTQPKYNASQTAIGWLAPNSALSEFPIAKNNSSPWPSQIAYGPDGAFWFTDIDVIGRLTRSGQLSEYPVPFAGKSPFGSGVQGITNGPNGTIWFTEIYGNRIGRVDTAGNVTEFPKLPTAHSRPFYITEGPDGALWFTEEFSGKIGRMTTGGSISEFQLPDSYPEPLGITVGPDGALWFAESDQSSAKIGRLAVQ